MGQRGQMETNKEVYADDVALKLEKINCNIFSKCSRAEHNKNKIVLLDKLYQTVPKNINDKYR